jgi:hypothetical protein
MSTHYARRFLMRRPLRSRTRKSVVGGSSEFTAEWRLAAEKRPSSRRRLAIRPRLRRGFALLFPWLDLFGLYPIRLVIRIPRHLVVDHRRLRRPSTLSRGRVAGQVRKLPRRQINRSQLCAPKRTAHCLYGDGFRAECILLQSVSTERRRRRNYVLANWREMRSQLVLRFPSQSTVMKRNVGSMASFTTVAAIL